MLGIAYAEGALVKENKRVGLAWFRESIRNGNPVSYLNAGDLLLEMDEKMFALVQYLGAYQHGALFLRERIEKVKERLE